MGFSRFNRLLFATEYHLQVPENEALSFTYAPSHVGYE